MKRDKIFKERKCALGWVANYDYSKKFRAIEDCFDVTNEQTANKGHKRNQMPTYLGR